MDVGAAPLVSRPAGTGRVHRAVLGAPRAGDAAPRRVAGGARGVRARHRALPPGRLPAGDRARGGRARRRAAAAGRVRRGRGGLPTGGRARPRPAARPGPAVAGPRVRRRRGGRRTPAAGRGRQPHRSRCRLLPAAVDVLLAVGALDEARNRRGRAGRSSPARSARSRCWPWRRTPSAAVELASGDPAGALPYLRKARQLWARADSPYESARVRLLTGRALAALGDEESARQEADRRPRHLPVPRRRARGRGGGAACCAPPASRPA